jgi:RHS repeat-associated protein
MNKVNSILIEVERFSTKYFDMSGIFTYDADGNFLTLTRSYNSDNFSYDYYSGTNRLRKITGTENQYTYDYNGNLTNDYFNNNTDIKFDHRNLITEITRVDNLIDPPATFTTTYKYVEDPPWRYEAGNRINKKITKDDGSTMEIIVNEYYIRDLSGKEIAIYQNDTLKFWNVWGLGNEGRITSEGTRYYYIKDHLGSIRAVLNENNDLVEAIDYDPWGHTARYWSSTTSKYKFTGKERDTETGYDYFGARYYDARIGRWGGVDVKFYLQMSYTPFNYCINNPLVYIDYRGERIFLGISEKYTKDAIEELRYITGLNLGIDNEGFLYLRSTEVKGGSEIARKKS